MKRVVTGVDEQGRSIIASVEELDPSQSHTLISYEPEQIHKIIEDIDPAITADWIGPAAAGGVVWRYTRLKPDSRSAGHTDHPGISEEGFHVSRTVDFDVVLSGELALVVDEGRVELQAGDVVIQMATNHAWKNETDETAVLLALIHKPIAE